MRTDITTDNRKVKCSNTRFTTRKYEAKTGDYIVWSYPDSPTQEYFAKVISRIASAPSIDDENCNGFLRVINVDFEYDGHAYERWVNPTWVMEVYPADYDPRELLNFFFSDWSKHGEVKLLKWAESGFKSMEAWEKYKEKMQCTR